LSARRGSSAPGSASNGSGALANPLAALKPRALSKRDSPRARQHAGASAFCYLPGENFGPKFFPGPGPENFGLEFPDLAPSSGDLAQNLLTCLDPTNFALKFLDPARVPEFWLDPRRLGSSPDQTSPRVAAGPFVDAPGQLLDALRQLLRHAGQLG